MFYIFSGSVNGMRAKDFMSGGVANSALEISSGDQKVDLYFKGDMLLVADSIARVFDAFNGGAPHEMKALLRSVLNLIDGRGAAEIDDVRACLNDVEALLAELQQMDAAE